MKIDQHLSKQDEQDKLIDALIYKRLSDLRDRYLTSATGIHDYLRSIGRIAEIIESAEHNLEFIALEKTQNEI